MNSSDEEALEKIKEIKYLRLDFLNKLKSLKTKQDKIVKEFLRCSDEKKIKQIREEIKSKYA